VSQVTPLDESQINRSSHDVVTIELVEPDDRPAWPVVGTPPTFVRIVWPLQPSVIDLARFPDVAATVAQLFARAHIVLAAIRAERRL
jgi:hypothetical protein